MQTTKQPIDETAKNRCIRLKDSHYEKLMHVGIDWLRKKLDKVKLPEKDGQ